MQKLTAQTSESTTKIEAVVGAEIKQLLQEAANLKGCSLNDFIVTVAKAEATRVIEQHRVLKLNPEDSHALAEAILNPQEPNDALKAAFLSHKQTFGD